MYCSPCFSMDFNPRPPRGGRPGTVRGRCPEAEISIHALREEGDLPREELLAQLAEISIHALREEGDAQTKADRKAQYEFQSTPSARRATHFGEDCQDVKRISIHALREEGDTNTGHNCKGRRKFQSTPSARRATDKSRDETETYRFQSTPSARRATSRVRFWFRGIPRFQSTPSARRAT